MKNRPTHTYTSLDAAYDHFNRELFAGQLPPCLITMQRHKGAYGYFSGGRFAMLGASSTLADEIALNPQHFERCGPVGVLDTLVHEMAHLWQFHFGKPSRNGYHNKEWAAKMKEVGLIPSTTGQPGGAETGQKVSDYPETGGRFERAVAAFLATTKPTLFHDPYGEEEKEKRKKKSASKTKYTCPVCGMNAWAKPEVVLICGDCREELEPEEAAPEGED